MRKAIRSSRAKFDNGTSIAIIDSVVEEISKIPTASFADGEDAAVNIVYLFVEDRRRWFILNEISRLGTVVSNLYL